MSNTLPGEYEVEIRGQKLIVFDVQMAPAEPDVGIMSRYVDGWNIKYADTGVPCGEEMDFTDEEFNIIYTAIDDAAVSDSMDEDTYDL